MTRALTLTLLVCIILEHGIMFGANVSLLCVLMFIGLTVSDVLYLRCRNSQSGLDIVDGVFVVFVLTVATRDRRLGQASFNFAVTLLPIITMTVSRARVSILLFDVGTILMNFLVVLCI